ncbi:MAG: flagellar biosynthesis pathway, component FliP [Planctomycetota bacterium]|nr:flagellar biosynthesis pathway, component FliP [Planctomycetota bacterium]
MRHRRFSALLAVAAFALLGGDDPGSKPVVPQPRGFEVLLPKLPDMSIASPATAPSTGNPPALVNSAQTMALFALISLAPAALLMVTAFVRISVVLTLLRQALGSPQIPGNQVLMALALLLTALVMRPVAESVYERGIKPYTEHRLDAKAAWDAGSEPIKVFMSEQIKRTGHEHYLWDLYERSSHPPGEPEPTESEQFSIAILAPAFLLSELTTALYIGFAVYLPFLVIDLVVSAVLGAMGLFMLPPALVALPLKLVLFVLADGWMLVAGMLLRSFSP